MSVKSLLADVFSFIFILLLMTLLVNILPIGPDAKLYFGVAENLLLDLGFVDTIRNDEILPSIGYPFLIMLSLKVGANEIMFFWAILFASFVFMYYGFKLLNLKYLFYPFFLLFILIYNDYGLWSIELGILLSSSFLFFSFSNLYKAKNFVSFFVLFLALFVHILVRPILLPYIIILSILVLIFNFKNFKKNLIYNLIIAFFWLGILSVGHLSYMKYEDNRYLTSTYSAIPLYSAWNPYINLNSVYYSALWDNLDVLKKEKALAPLKNESGWKDRDIFLKKQVIDFAISEPYKALNGYVWRILKYSLNADSFLYKIFFVFWVLFCFSILLKFKKMLSFDKSVYLILSSLAVYAIFSSSLFAYAGFRYSLTTFLFLYFSMAFYLSLRQKLKHQNDNYTQLDKNILFLSANDFKEKSIQVLRKTPEAYVKNGWNVDYIVARDTSKSGNYYYEKIINVEKINIIRFKFPFTSIRDFFKKSLLKTIATKISGYFVILKLAYLGNRVVKKNNINIIYGYEIHGVLAAKIIKTINSGLNIKYVHRFMGTWIYSYFFNRRYFKLLLNLDAILALKLDSDLCIMTNDGTEGDKALKKINSKSLDNFRFWTNGVDKYNFSDDDKKSLRKKYNIKNEKIFISISRLEVWKKVERSILVFNEVILLRKDLNIKFFIIGDGPESIKLKKLVKKLKLENHIIFVGSLKHKEAMLFLYMADFFFSFYDLSNVGNPLFEAIRAHKIIITLDNGDTKRWIKHKENGYIYKLNTYMFAEIAKDILELLDNTSLFNSIKANIKKTEASLWTWEKRLNAEVKETYKLLRNN